MNGWLPQGYPSVWRGEDGICRPFGGSGPAFWIITSAARLMVPGRQSDVAMGKGR